MTNKELIQIQEENERRTAEVIRQMGLHFHHTGSRRGYCRVSRIGSYEPYEGKFGKGIIVRTGRMNGTSTSFESIDYYVKPE